MRFTHIISVTAAMAVFASLVFAGPSPADKSTENARLLKSVAADAHRIRLAAAEFQNLTKSPTATWQQYDRQWNEIQPAVEMLGRKITRLEAMESSLTAEQKQALTQSKADYQKISWQSRELGKLVDMVPPNLQSHKLKIETRELVNEAGDIAHAVKSGA